MSDPAAHPTIDAATVAEIEERPKARIVRHTGAILGIVFGLAAALTILVISSRYDYERADDMPAPVACIALGVFAIFLGLAALYVRWAQTDSNKQTFCGGIGIGSVVVGLVSLVMLGISFGWHEGTDLALNGVEAMMGATLLFIPLIVVEMIATYGLGGMRRRSKTT